MNPPRICVICHSRGFCDSIASLNSHESEVIIYFSYHDFVESGESFDVVVVTDDLAPGENPLEAVKQVKSKCREIPVIFLGFEEKTVKRAQFYGADEAYTLPVFQFVPGELVERAIKRFKRRQMAQEPRFKEEPPEKPAD